MQYLLNFRKLVSTAGVANNFVSLDSSIIMEFMKVLMGIIMVMRLLLTKSLGWDFVVMYAV